jgi:hypothetical protein
MTESVARLATQEKQIYANGEERPIFSYALTMSTYLALSAALGGLVRASSREVPERFGAADMALLCVATHRLSRTIAKDPVTSPLRAPFTVFRGTSGPAELKEDVRGTGIRKSVGELVTCPFCLAQWTATGFAFGLVLAPRPTRMVMSVFTAVAVSDALQFAYAALEKVDS